VAVIREALALSVLAGLLLVIAAGARVWIEERRSKSASERNDGSARH
jgi:hypothetical protein